jgi:hypothetical protein
MSLTDQEITNLQFDGPKRHVHIKFRDNSRMHDVLHSTGGQVEYWHTCGEISKARISTAGMKTRNVQIANLPPEMSDGVLRAVLNRYGNVMDIQAEKWACL